MRTVWHWLTNQLAVLFPPADSAELVRGKDVSTELRISRDRIDLYSTSSPLAPSKTHRHLQQFESLDAFARLGAGKKQLVVCFDEAVYFMREVSLPQSAFRRIEKILSLDLGRLIHLSTNELFTGWTPLIFNESGKCVVLQVVIRRADVHAVLNAAKQAGSRVVAFAFRREDGTPLPIALEPDGRVFGERSRLFWNRVATCAAMLCLTSATTLTAHAFWKQSQLIEQFVAETVLVQEGARVVRSKIDALKLQHARAESISALRKQSIDPLELWTNLTEHFPEQAWVQNLQISRSGVKVDGFATDAEVLIKTLEALPRFKAVKFSAPVFRDPMLDKMRFSLTAELEQ